STLRSTGVARLQDRPGWGATGGNERPFYPIGAFDPDEDRSLAEMAGDALNRPIRSISEVTEPEAWRTVYATIRRKAKNKLDDAMKERSAESNRKDPPATDPRSYTAYVHLDSNGRQNGYRFRSDKDEFLSIEMRPAYLSVGSGKFAPMTHDEIRGFNSFHSSLDNMLMADGRVIRINESIDAGLYASLGMRDDSMPLVPPN
ncbi:MAG: hypothetical protein AAFP69_15165, partial [Planctomycetota bacterium]